MFCPNGKRRPVNFRLRRGCDTANKPEAARTGESKKLRNSQFRKTYFTIHKTIQIENNLDDFTLRVCAL
jgi:hypothetical protein